MDAKKFVDLFYPYAKQTHDKTGISPVAILAQAAIESGWGEHAPGNMFFGVKDSDGINGNEQLITTTEYHTRVDIKYPEVISVTPCVINGVKKFKYRVKDYFRKYETPEECFTDHAQFFFKNPRYHLALQFKSDALKFIDLITIAGYATDPNYASTLKSIAKKIQGLLL